MFCFHKYGEIKAGYQYCHKCGKAIVSPVKRCEHEWVFIKEIMLASAEEHYRGQGEFYTKLGTRIFACKKCGVEKHDTIEV